MTLPCRRPRLRPAKAARRSVQPAASSTVPTACGWGSPPGAVDSDVTFRIARDGSGAPPLPGGIDLLSAVYAITPHGQVFNQPVAVRVPSNVAQAAGRPTFLMKAEPGGRWAVIGTDSGAVDALTASIDSLSYVAVGACTNNLPPNSPFAQNCPTSNVLRFELLTDSGDPFPVSQDTTYSAIQPVLLVTTPTVLTGRITWTRAPFAAARVDTLETGSRFTGTATGVIVQRQLGIAWSAEAPNVREVTQNFTSTFTITVTPAQVASARNPNGVVRPLWAQARAGEWEYNAVIPIRIRDVSAPTPAPAPAPTITQQPANAGVVEGQPASFSVVASVTPAAALTYQWSRRADANAAFAPIAGATAATFNLAATALTDNGSQFQVAVCAAPSLCVISNPATLTVTQAPVAPSFTLQPANIAVVAGQTASFTVTATGNPLPRIDWQSAPASDPNNFTSLSVAPNCVRTDPPASGTSTTATCTVGPLAIADSGRRYRAAATNGFTTTSAVATLTVNAAPVAPAITVQPVPQTTTVGGSAVFSVTATGTAPLGYSWRLNGTPLPSISGQFNISNCIGDVTYSNGNATITLTGVTGGCNGVVIDVTVSNGVGSVTSNPAALTVSGTSSPWTTQTVNFRNALTSVFAVNSRTAWATSASGEVLRTIDGGATWSVQVSGGNNLSDISAVDANTAWAVGGESIVKTIDGGATWSLQNGAAGEYLYSVSAVNAQVAWAVGFAGVILKTTDGGASWITQVAATNAQKNLTSVVAVDQNTAWAVGTFQILKTTDGGISWISQTSAVPAAVQGFLQVVAATDRVAWIVTDRRDTRAAVLRTADGGVTWNDVTRPGTAESTHRLAAVRGNPNLLWALTSTGFDNSRAHISSNGGNSWTQRSTSRARNSLRRERCRRDHRVDRRRWRAHLEKIAQAAADFRQGVDHEHP